jgi:hypothetical protein
VAYLDSKAMALPEVKKVCRLGYSITYKLNEQEHIRWLYMSVFRSGVPVANACFRFNKESGVQVTETIAVYEGHRRQGLANALMSSSMYLTNCTPHPASGQTPDGRAWWAQPNRPW